MLLLLQVTCACLAKAGPQKSRMMDTLHRDARSPALEGYFMLDRMYVCVCGCVCGNATARVSRSG